MAIAGVKSGAGLLAARFCLGIPESGVGMRTDSIILPFPSKIANNYCIVPCCVMYFSFWYRPRERALRLAIFHVSNSIAGAVSGFLATALDNVRYSVISCSMKINSVIAQRQRWSHILAMGVHCRRGHPNRSCTFHLLHALEFSGKLDRAY